jgi:hypothetical protein
MVSKAGPERKPLFIALNPLLHPFIYGVPLGLSVILLIFPSSTWASSGHPAAPSSLQLTGIVFRSGIDGFVFI